jgi:hypothetical protein
MVLVDHYKYSISVLETTGFMVESIEEGLDNLYGKKSAFIKVMAIKF